MRPKCPPLSPGIGAPKTLAPPLKLADGSTTAAPACTSLVVSRVMPAGLANAVSDPSAREPSPAYAVPSDAALFSRIKNPAERACCEAETRHAPDNARRAAYRFIHLPDFW